MTQTSQGRSALDQLCQRYWEPLNLYACSRGYSSVDADDITQSFFAHLIENKTHTRAEPERGRFRTFLLSAMQNFIANDRRNATRLKRGGGVTHESIDDHSDIIGSPETPEMLFERKWAQAVIAAAVAELEREYTNNGRADRFAAMKPLLGVRHQGDTAALAESLNLSVANFRKLLQGFRNRFGDLVREEIGRLVSDPSEVDDELAHLMRVLQS